MNKLVKYRIENIYYLYLQFIGCWCFMLTRNMLISILVVLPESTIFIINKDDKFIVTSNYTVKCILLIYGSLYVLAVYICIIWLLYNVIYTDLYKYKNLQVHSCLLLLIHFKSNSITLVIEYQLAVIYCHFLVNYRIFWIR